MSEAEPGLTQAMWTGLVRRPDFGEYSVKYRDFFAMRRQDGIVELRMHRDGGPYYQTMASHNAWGQAWLEVGNDPLNQVLILTGTGEKWFDGQRGAAAHFTRTTADIAKTYEDAAKLLGYIAEVEQRLSEAPDRPQFSEGGPKGWFAIIRRFTKS